MTVDSAKPRPDPPPDRLPDHEIDEDESIAGGLMSAGGTAVDRGTGTLSGQAQGPDAAPGPVEAYKPDGPVMKDDGGEPDGSDDEADLPGFQPRI